MGTGVIVNSVNPGEYIYTCHTPHLVSSLPLFRTLIKGLILVKYWGFSQTGICSTLLCTYVLIVMGFSSVTYLERRLQYLLLKLCSHALSIHFL